MKKHAMIPVFIPHIGCPCECVFCDQNTITARTGAPSEEDVVETVETRLPTLRGRGLEQTEIAFFGGSFTAIPKSMQERYLRIAKRYKDERKVDRIRLSTRPDCIDDEILDLLEAYSVDAIELGAQSFSDKVLALSKRGHGAQAIREASRLIKGRGFELGLQLMIGLPGDDRETSLMSAKEAVSLEPDTARLYPTVVLKGTELAEMMESGVFVPMDEETLLDITTEMYKVFLEAEVTILRVGLKSTDLITNSADLSNGYHPAFRQLVEGRIAMEKMTALLRSDDIEEYRPADGTDIVSDCGGIMDGYVFRSNEKWFPPMIGHKACNRKALDDMFPIISFSFETDNSLQDGEIKILRK